MTPSDPRVGEIQARLSKVNPGPWGLYSFHAADVAYLLAQLRERDEALTRVGAIEQRLERSMQGEDREIAEDLRAAVAAATGGGDD